MTVKVVQVRKHTLSRDNDNVIFYFPEILGRSGQWKNRLTLRYFNTTEPTEQIHNAVKYIHHTQVQILVTDVCHCVLNYNARLDKYNYLSCNLFQLIDHCILQRLFVVEIQTSDNSYWEATVTDSFFAGWWSVVLCFCLASLLVPSRLPRDKPDQGNLTKRYCFWQLRLLRGTVCLLPMLPRVPNCGYVYAAPECTKGHTHACQSMHHNCTEFALLKVHTIFLV